ncbi:extracellular solute-binding protein [Gracilibacillus phocaeensis]|uniref:extracellular solute-binding protein n=1 Tax=Gracilibacillus phocaeensis TaxID=2042304 RepID=UPI00103247A1|nr:extracellular solute-binding protein [Gracilibacillus phocaeensis]
MKKYMKFWAMLILISSILIITGCNSDSTDSDNSSAEESSENEGFSYLMHDKFIDWLQENNWYEHAIEATDADIEFVAGGSNDDEYYSSVDQQIISGSFPDSGIVTVNQATVYGTEGAFLDLKPFIEEHAPNIKQYIADHPNYENLITTDEGAIYGVVAEAPKFADFLFYRADHFEKAGITEEPQTIEEFTDALRQLKEFYGEDNPNYYPMIGREGFIRFQSVFNATANFEDGVFSGIYGNAKTGTDLYSEGYKQMVEWYHTLYDEGLIDPEWVAGASTEESWESKMLTGSGSIGYDHYTRPSWFMDNGGPDNDPDYDIQIMSYLQDVNGKPSVQPTETQYNALRSMVINKDSEDKAETIIKFLDYFFSEEGQELVSWGVEGESFEEVDGKKQFIVDFSEEETTPAGEPRWSFLNDRLTFVKPIDNNAFYQWNTDLVREAALDLFTDENLEVGINITYTAEQSQQIANLSATVNEAVIAGVTKFVTGERDLSEWDDFLAEMEEAGYQQIVGIQQEAYDALYK